MSRRLVPVLVLLAAVGTASAARAQAPTPAPNATQNAAAAAPIVNVWYVGGAVGAGIVDSASVTGNVEAGFRIWKNLDLLVEGGYAGNLATRRELDRAGTIAASVQATQGVRSRRASACRGPMRPSEPAGSSNPGAGSGRMCS